MIQNATSLVKGECSLSLSFVMYLFLKIIIFQTFLAFEHDKVIEQGQTLFDTTTSVSSNTTLEKKNIHLC